MLNKSNVTSISFTVSDDLISQNSLNSTRKTAFHGLKPFSKQYGLNQQSLDERPLPNKANRQIIQRAQIDAYREMNEHLYNPFQHKLGNGFIPKESDLYQIEKMKQIQLLKKKQEEIMGSKNNYTIVFHNQKKSKHNLQMAGKNIVAGQNQVPNIADYYNKKFNKKSMENIQQQNDQNEDGHENANKKVNNFIASTKKNQKKVGSSQNQQKKPVNISKQKIDSNNQKKSTQQQKSFKSISSNQSFKRQQKNKKNQTQLKNKDRASQLKNTINNKNKIQNQQIPIKSQTPKPSQNLIKKQQIGQNIPSTFNLSNKNIQINKKQPIKKQITKKPPIPRASKKVEQNKKKKYSQVYDGPDRNLVEQLQRQLTQCPTISFDDIAQLQVAKNLLQEAVLLPRLMPQFFQGIRKAMRGILLFGPPGTGKTLLAKAIAKDNIFFNVSASSLASKWKGQSEKMVRLLFEMAKYHSPSVIFFDEIDCIGSKRSENQHQSARKVKTELLVQMDGVGSTENEVFVLAATNRPWDLDQALRRRLQKRIYIPLPGTEGRKKMFQINLKGLKVSQKVNWDKLIQLTKGCSGADICNVCRDAAYMPMRRKITQVGGIAKLQDLKQSQLINEEVLQSDLIQSAKKVKPSVGKEDLKRYQTWMAQFGSS